jgi:NADPH:quinone reductase-like Zn-dependent oxidoreductase
MIMKAAVIHNYGAPDVLIYENYPDPKPAAGEVVMRVAAAGVNPVDLCEREGGTKDWRPVVFPAVLGWDLAGTIVALGEGVCELALGESVFGWAYHTYAELCPSKRLCWHPCLPASISIRPRPCRS